jgi:hypothetical protein
VQHRFDYLRQMGRLDERNRCSETGDFPELSRGVLESFEFSFSFSLFF